MLGLLRRRKHTTTTRIEKPVFISASYVWCERGAAATSNGGGGFAAPSQHGAAPAIFAADDNAALELGAPKAHDGSVEITQNAHFDYRNSVNYQLQIPPPLPLSDGNNNLLALPPPPDISIVPGAQSNDDSQYVDENPFAGVSCISFE